MLLMPILSEAQVINFYNHDFLTDSSNCTITIGSGENAILFLNDTTSHCDGHVVVSHDSIVSHSNLSVFLGGIISNRIGIYEYKLHRSLDTFNFQIESDTNSNSFVLRNNLHDFISVGDSDGVISTSLDSLTLHPDTNFLPFGELASHTFFSSPGGKVRILLNFLEPVKVFLGTDSIYNTEIWIDSDQDWDNFITSSCHWYDFDNPIGFEAINSNASAVTLDSLPLDIYANSILKLTGSGFMSILQIDNQYQGMLFEVLSDTVVDIFIPKTAPDTLILTFNTYLGRIVSAPFFVKPGWQSSSFDSYVSVLYEDSLVKSYIKWSKPNVDSIYTYIVVLSALDTSTNVLTFIRADSVNNSHFFIHDSLTQYSNYLMELYQWNSLDNAYSLADEIVFNAENDGGPDDQLYVSRGIWDNFGNWGDAHDTLTYVEFVQGFDLHPYELRSYLQAINGGLGFDQSQYPWYSDSGPIYSRGPGVGPPVSPDPPEDDPGNPSPCICKLAINTHYEDIWDDSKFLEPGSTEERGWYKPRLQWLEASNKNSHREWIRTQRAGASVYHDIMTLKKKYSVQEQTYNYYHTCPKRF
jgi:hypothetical protein